jgi:adenylate cyclase
VTLLPAEKRAIETRGTQSVEAYNLYLMARQQWTEGSLGDVRRQEAIVRMCKHALTFDPEYADAWALMALAQSQMRFWHGTNVDPAPAAEKALSINPNLAEAHCVKAHLLEEQGRKDEAVAEIDTAVRLDPESWEVNREAARLLFRQGRIRDAIPYFEKAVSLMDWDWHNAFMLTTCYREIGEPDRRQRAAQVAVDRAEKAMVKDPSNATVLAGGAYALAALGEDQRANEWIERALLLDPDNNIMRYNLACALATDLNDPDRAIDVLGPYFSTTLGVTHIRHAEVDPDLDALREDPRFGQMLGEARQRLGITA